MKEIDIQIEIVEYLSLIKDKCNLIYFSPQNENFSAGKTRGEFSGADFGRLAKAKKAGLRSGVSDLIIGHKGKMYCMEVKTPRGKQSENQKDFMKDAYKAGCEYAIVRSFESAVDALRIWGIV